MQQLIVTNLIETIDSNPTSTYLHLQSRIPFMNHDSGLGKAGF